MSVDKSRPPDSQCTGGLLSARPRYTRWRLKGRKSSSVSGYGSPHHGLTATRCIVLKPLYACRTPPVRNASGPSHPPTIVGRRASFWVCSCCCPGAISRLKQSNHHPVYDVSNRETFDALPRWYSELETYVSESVVKIIVGNKVDKVCRSPPPLRLIFNTSAGILPASTNIRRRGFCPSHEFSFHRNFGKDRGWS